MSNTVSIIETINAEKKDRHIVPVGATLLEISNRSDLSIAELKAELNQLFKDKIVDYYKTLNSVAFFIKGQQIS